MPKDWTAYLAARCETETSIRVVECRLDAGAVKEISREVLAARLAHLVGFEERAAYAVLCVLAKTVPRVGVRFYRPVEQFFQKSVD